MKGKTKYTKEVLEPIVNESTSLSEVVRKVTNSKKAHGSMIAYIKEKIIINNIDYSHFTGNGWCKGKVNPTGIALDKETFINNYLIEKPIKTTSSTNLKNYLYKFKLKNRECEKCGIKNEWEGKELTHQLDHINGNNQDNRIENLRMLCPNCHSQTITYAGKNKIKKEG